MIIENLPILLNNPSGFQQEALRVFHYQAEFNMVYRSFIEALNKNPQGVKSLSGLPFLPVEFFKQHKVISGSFEPEYIFESSTTTGSVPSRHYVKALDDYEFSSLNSFRLFYGDPKNYRILALLPSYLERKGSSLVYMLDHLIKTSGQKENGFYLYNHSDLASVIMHLEKNKQKCLLLGVSFALLDFAEAFPMQLHNTIIMETGGMKGRREEITRQELHLTLKEAFGVPTVHSEYGMTELLSQAYSTGEGIFRCPPWMRVVVRDPYDPLHLLPDGQTGALNVIDLANYWSCSFLATSDLGRVYSDGSFEILGRLDQSEIRGCNLMVM